MAGPASPAPVAKPALSAAAGGDVVAQAGPDPASRTPARLSVEAASTGSAPVAVEAPAPSGAEMAEPAASPVPAPPPGGVATADPAALAALTADAPAPARDAPAAAPAPDARAATAGGLVAARDVALALVNAGDRDRIELRLDPPELGRVLIDIRTSDGAVSAAISAERPETLELLRRHADALQRELNAAGFGQADVAFSDRRAGAQADDARGFAAALDEPEPAPAVAPARLYSRPTPGGLDRLDIRL